MENTLLVPQCRWHRSAQFWTVKSAGFDKTGCFCGKDVRLETCLAECASVRRRGSLAICSGTRSDYNIPLNPIDR